jgi:hypothetical protein
LLSQAFLLLLLLLLLLLKACTARQLSAAAVAAASAAAALRAAATAATVMQDTSIWLHIIWECITGLSARNNACRGVIVFLFGQNGQQGGP